MGDLHYCTFGNKSVHHAHSIVLIIADYLMMLVVH